ELPLVERLNSDAFRSAANSITALRLENFSKFLPRRMERLQEALKTYGEVHVVGNEDSLYFWNELRQLSPMIGRTEQLWRISTLPNKGALLVSDIQRYREAEAFFDWSGGLIWLSIPQAADAGASDIRRALAAYGGHATLIRADEEVRSNVEIFQPLDHGTERMTRNIKQAFDPAGILNKGRMYANI
ncbi:MAG: FAD-binding protein, partial [Pseudomonadota bacterium]